MKEEMLRNSERSTYKRCRLKWHWSYGKKLTPQREKGALQFGRLGHATLACWYIPGKKRGEHPAEAFERLFNELPDETRFPQWDDEGNKHDPLTLGIQMMTGYVELYGKEPHIEIIASEMMFEVDVFDKQGNYLVTYVGTFDAVGLDHSFSPPRLFLYEHKTGKAITNVAPISGYGEQGLSYWWGSTHHLRAMGLLKPDQFIEEVRFNWLKKAMPDTRPRNAAGHALNKPGKDALLDRCEALGLELPKNKKVENLIQLLEEAGENWLLLGEPSARQPQPLYARQPLRMTAGNLETLDWRIRAEAYEMGQVRLGKLPLIKTPTRDCSWDCPFFDACEIHEMGGDWQGVLDLEFNEWAPYAGHELQGEHDH